VMKDKKQIGWELEGGKRVDFSGAPIQG
jgi:hypothetical protein